MSDIKKIYKNLNKGIETGVFKNAELLVAKQSQIVIHQKAGELSDDPFHFFDLASLTKPLCTALLCLLIRQKGKFKLRSTVLDFFPSKNLDLIQVKDLLNHTSGLKDWFPFYNDFINQDRCDYKINKSLVLSKILNDPSFFDTQGKTLYSDLGFILLGAILEKITDTSLSDLFEQEISKKLGIEQDIFFVPLEKKSLFEDKYFIPSEKCPTRHKTMQGEVMDRNAYVLGGVAGHAGLFAQASAIHRILCELREASLNQSSLISQKSFDRFCRPDPQRNRKDFHFTLGFDTPTDGISQSGQYFSSNTIGHLGYSGTSFWWDLDQDLWIILLTNRCYPDRKNFKIQQFRPQFHDLIYQTFTQQQPAAPDPVS